MIKKSARYTAELWIPAENYVHVDRKNNGYEISASSPTDHESAIRLIRRFAENILKELNKP